MTPWRSRKEGRDGGDATEPGATSWIHEQRQPTAVIKSKRTFSSFPGASTVGSRHYRTLHHPYSSSFIERQLYRAAGACQHLIIPAFRWVFPRREAPLHHSTLLITDSLKPFQDKSEPRLSRRPVFPENAALFITRTHLTEVFLQQSSPWKNRSLPIQTRLDCLSVIFSAGSSGNDLCVARQQCPDSKNLSRTFATRAKSAVLRVGPSYLTQAFPSDLLRKSYITHSSGRHFFPPDSRRLPETFQHHRCVCECVRKGHHVSAP